MRYRNIAITGASSGLGRALALGFAGPGVTLHLTGRNAERLGEVAAAARAKGAQAIETLLDVTDAPATEAWILGCPELDLVIANAGISVGPGHENVERAERIRAVFATNVEGVFNTVLPAMQRRTRRIALIGSIAGLIALPSSPAYSAAKAALDFWVRAAAPRAARYGIGLTLVRPGFIRTPMTAQNPYPMPGLMTAETAAACIIAGLERERDFITFPWFLALLAWFGNLLPKALFARIPGKPASHA
jgi:NAD(P)-dependent dehydrogenase (short-subunit alcohol dehydrogenase family)